MFARSHQEIDMPSRMCKYMHIETRTSRIKRRLRKDSWYLDRHGSNQDIYAPHDPWDHYSAASSEDLPRCRHLNRQESRLV